jgi:hypothetical protein
LGLKARCFLLEVLLRRPLRLLRLLLRRLALAPLPERLLDLQQQHNRGCYPMSLCSLVGCSALLSHLL